MLMLKNLIATVGKLEFVGTCYEALNRLLQANKLERYNLKGMLRADYTFNNNEM